MKKVQSEVKMQLDYFMSLIENDLNYAGEGETTVDLKSFLEKYKEEYADVMYLINKAVKKSVEAKRETLDKEDILSKMKEYLEMMESDKEGFDKGKSYGITLSKYSSNLIHDYKELMEEISTARVYEEEE